MALPETEIITYSCQAYALALSLSYSALFLRKLSTNAVCVFRLKENDHLHLDDATTI